MVLEYITRSFSLFSGAVVTLGRIAAQLAIPLELRLDRDVCGSVSLDGTGQVEYSVDDRREPAQPVTITYL